MTWSESTGVAATAVEASFVFLDDVRELQGSWTVLAPHGPTTLVLPALPAELASLGPQATDLTSQPIIQIEHVEGGDLR